MPFQMVLFYLVGVALFAVPFWVLLPRAGLHPAYAALCLLLPAGPIILLWLVAFNDRMSGGTADGD